MNASIVRRALLGVAAGACLTAAGLASAQDAGTIRLVVPFGAGTTTDSVGRVLADALGKELKQTVIVDNRPGAGGSTGSAQVAKATPDGKTLVLGTVGTHAINASLFRKLPYDPQKDFVPIAFAGYTPLLLVVPANSSAKLPNDLMASAQRQEGISFASAGNGTSGHLAGELLAKRGGKMLHVPYKEGSQALTDLISGNVDFMFYHPTAVVSHLKAGKLRALGVSSTVRSPLAPEVPTLAEQGLPEFDLIAWFMLYAPAGTPAQALERLRKAATSALAGADTQARLVAQGVELRGMRSDELAAFNGIEIGKWAELVKRSGAQVD
jgi:tripartite-type tricarboxylate transporter receptor subunit TctC